MHISDITGGMIGGQLILKGLIVYIYIYIYIYIYMYVYIYIYIYIYVYIYISLSTLVHNSRDQHEKYGFPKKTHLESNLATTFSSKYCHTIYWYDAISTINPFKQLKRALESKLSNFKIFESC